MWQLTDIQPAVFVLMVMTAGRVGDPAGLTAAMQQASRATPSADDGKHIQPPPRAG
jgi:hypothetical protein